ncbi:MAG TPA: class I SAM-dependent methyltransferase [Gaiellaceae bacterium]|nr:class I SAM-dependent methyltransferase [Gaiellaceae bacterium]
MRAHVWGTAPEFVGPRHELRERLLLDLLLSARPGPEVLDGGAGQGTMSRRLAALGFDVTSTDASPEAIAALRKRTTGQVVEADLTALPFEDASFDAAVLGEVLEHIEDDRAALTEVARVLRLGGVLTLSVPANPKLFGPSDVWAGHVRRYTRPELLQACADAGFTVHRCLGWGFPMSRLYHRHVYERYLGRRGPAGPKRRHGPLVSVVGALLQLDRLFVGVDRGALGYLALATRR